MYRALLISFLIIAWSFANGQANYFKDSKKLRLNSERLQLSIEFQFEESSQVKNEKLKAAILTVLLGHFGVHRIYLGTSPNVPVVYSLTLGGGLGLLPLADLIAILTADDLSAYRDSEKVFMWLKN